MFISELQELDSSHFNVASLRRGVMAEEPCPIESMKRVVSAMHCTEMVIGYSQTESTPINTMSRADDDVEVRCMTVGWALPEIKVRIASSITGQTLPVGFRILFTNRHAFEHPSVTATVFRC